MKKTMLQKLFSPKGKRDTFAFLKIKGTLYERRTHKTQKGKKIFSLIKV